MGKFPWQTWQESPAPARVDVFASEHREGETLTGQNERPRCPAGTLVPSNESALVILPDNFGNPVRSVANDGSFNSKCLVRPCPLQSHLKNVPYNIIKRGPVSTSCGITFINIDGWYVRVGILSPRRAFARARNILHAGATSYFNCGLFKLAGGGK